jgi:DNA invertase Pin-like site-specific DNA recombinase
MATNRRKRTSSGPSRGVIYGRQSRTKEKSESLPTQRATCVETAERHGVEIVGELFEPPSTSAYKNRGRDRKRWPELLDMIRSGAANVVVAYKTDRLSRGGGPGWAPLLDAAESAGLDLDRFVMIAGNGYMSEFEIGIRATMDREESRKTSERLGDLKERHAAEGRPSGGARSFGYQSDGVTVNQAEARLIKEAAKRVLAGEEITTICREWNRKGVVTSAGKPWRFSTLKRLLLSPRVAGLRQHGTEHDGRGERPVVVGPATWPAILDRATWEKLRVTLDDPTRDNTRKGTYLLTGLCYCERCGTRMHGSRCGGWPVYRCSNRFVNEPCSIAVSTRPIDKFVSEAVVTALSGPEMAAALRAEKQQGDDGAAEKALLVAEERLLEIAEAYGAGELDRAGMLAARRKAEAVRDAARAKVQTVRRAGVLDGDDPATVASRWPKLSVDHRRAVIKAVIDRIEVRKGVIGKRFDPVAEAQGLGRLTITWRS